jgi:SAM-dependent methyltransferase
MNHETHSSFAGLRAIDLGCGAGRLTIRMARYGVHVIAVDHSQLLLSQVERMAQEENLAVDCVNCDITEYPFCGKCDIVLFSFVVHLLQFDELSRICQLARDATRKGGTHVFAMFSDARFVAAINRSYRSDPNDVWHIERVAEFSARAMSGVEFPASVSVATVQPAPAFSEDDCRNHPTVQLTNRLVRWAADLSESQIGPNHAVNGSRR